MKTILNSVLAIAAAAALQVHSQEPTKEGGGEAKGGDAKQGFQVVRQLDCARCHGASYEGQVGPSLLASAKQRSAEDFKRLVLEGNPGKGMPAYKNTPSAVENIDAMYAYFKGRAEGTVEAKPK
jgi:mono/diheme cytochrome c family protein